jgi:hypothetical protein
LQIEAHDKAERHRGKPDLSGSNDEDACQRREQGSRIADVVVVPSDNYGWTLLAERAGAALTEGGFVETPANIGG